MFRRIRKKEKVSEFQNKEITIVYITHFNDNDIKLDMFINSVFCKGIYCSKISFEDATNNIKCYDEKDKLIGTLHYDFVVHYYETYKDYSIKGV